MFAASRHDDPADFAAHWHRMGGFMGLPETGVLMNHIPIVLRRAGSCRWESLVSYRIAAAARLVVAGIDTAAAARLVVAV